MEYILNKNIFNDKDLCKLAPDYSYRSFILRMQARRSLSKDTHTHGIAKPHHTSAWQRKTIKRLKDDYKMNHEIVKIKNCFNKINLKNQIMVKHVMKHVDNINPQNHKYLDDFYNQIKNDSDPLLLDFFEDTAELVVLNDKDFKIKEKHSLEKPTVATEEKKIQPESIVEENNEARDENILRIECRLHTLLNLDQLGDSESDEEEENVCDEETKEQVQNVVDFHGTEIDKQVNSLESLLTMMAIGPNTDEKTTCCDETVDEAHEAKTNFIFDGNEKKSNSIKVIHKRVNQTKKIDDITDVISVTPIKIKMIDKELVRMKKYVAKWRDYVAKKKEYMTKQREQTLNNFFEKFTMKKKIVASKSSDPGQKAMLLAKDGMYQHRYKVQKHIIALQKAKLAEQNRIIEELKYNKIVEASKQSVDALREDFRKTYNDFDRNFKPKLKCISNGLKIQIEEPSLVLHCMKVPQFLQRMEKRAREREEKHAVIRERRRQMEEERLRLKQQAELAKAEMDKEEKMKILKELREKRKREKIESIRKKQYAERMRALNVMADLHYEKSLKTKYGINSLRILLGIKRDNIEKANAHYCFQLKKNVFLHWMWRAEDMWYERNFKAEDFYRKKLLRKAFVGLKKNTQELELQKQVAEDYYDLYVLRLVFRRFCVAVNMSRKEHEEQMEKAVRYYECDLLFKAFTYWRTLPALNAIKREQEARKAKWRQKVLQVVPDYTPPDD